MKIKNIALAVTLALGVSNIALAQETSSAIRGVVTTEAGTTVANATVTLTDKRSGTTRTLTTNDTGTFSARGLQVGGPYLLVVKGADGLTETIDNVFLTLGDTQSINVTIQQPDVERIAVTGTAISNSNYGGTGPAANFNLEDLRNTPAINRDLRDVVRVDPRIYINETNAGDIQCAGANPRFNSLTVDGVRTNDNFGLNSSGYPTERMPFSYDAIEQVAVELAPFDVKYGGFTACNINAVTKSGGNEFSGSVFFDYTNDSLQGDKLEGDKINVGAFNERRYGFNGGGAIVSDKLFWFAAYEKLEGAETFDRGPEGSNAAREVSGITQAQVDEIARIARDVYGFEPGGFPASIPVEDEKILLKLDWFINDYHRAAFTYNYNDGFSIAESDGDDDELEFSGHFYERGAEFNSYVANIFSDWTDSFSTEVRVGYSELDARVSPLGGTEVGEIQLRVGPTVYLGADDSRHSNKLTYETTFFKLAGNYLYGDHSISFGVEREQYDVFNLFIQETEGEYVFNSIEDFAAGIPSSAIYENAAGTNNPIDGAGQFKYAVNTAYVQDEFYIVDHDLTVTYGLRYDWYSTSDSPRVNQNFTDTYGFANDATLDGEGLLQPRLGINWMASPELEVRGGIGLYSGGNPNVWLSNNYSNNGISLYQASTPEDFFNADNTLFDIPHTGAGNPLIDIPQQLFDEVSEAAGRGPVNALDPNFKLPKEWKYALGATYTFDSGYVVMADLLYTKKEDAAIVSDLRRSEAGGFGAIGVLPDGRPLYPSIPRSVPEAFLLTNVNGDSGANLSASISVSKSYDFGLDITAAYAYTDSEDVNPMTSSVAYSNYGNLATADFENPGIAKSNYEIPHRFTLRATYKMELLDGYDTTFSLFGSANEGRPYSFTMNGNGDIFTGRQLLYVPTGVDDPNFVAGSVTDRDTGVVTPFDTDGFFAFIQREGLSKYAGGYAPRNEFNSDWWVKVDFRFEQELPGFVEGHRSSVFFVIDNLTNLINDDWGVLYETSFPRAVNVANFSATADNKYQFNSFNAGRVDPVQGRSGEPSLWSMRLGFEYKF